jgi:hypothetical protein
MARLTKTDAARQLGIARSTLYKLIDQGKLSATPEGLIDQAELVRVAATVDVVKGRSRTSADTHDIPAYFQAEDTNGRPQTPDRGQPETDVRGRPQTSADVVVDILREQLQAAQERERDYREHIARLTEMLDQAHQQNQRLLDLPRSPALPPHSPQDAPGATQSARRPQTPVAPQAPPGDPRGAMRRRILALLQDHPEGLTPAEIRDRLGVDRPLGDTLLGMRKYGLVQRVGRGRYVATEPS